MNIRWGRCQQGYTTCHRDDRELKKRSSPELLVSGSDLDGHWHPIGRESYGTRVRQSVVTFCGLAFNTGAQRLSTSTCRDANASLQRLEES
jgi:hypothetical protein